MQTQKLRENYNNRKTNRSTSNNGSGQANNILVKNFREKQYDKVDTFDRGSRASASFDKMLGTGKENQTLNEK